jgi:hypothetical protein
MVVLCLEVLEDKKDAAKHTCSEVCSKLVTGCLRIAYAPHLFPTRLLDTRLVRLEIAAEIPELTSMCTIDSFILRQTDPLGAKSRGNPQGLILNASRSGIACSHFRVRGMGRNERLR